MNKDHLDPVTVLGLGPMGSALAAAFVETGHRTTVWNRTASKADALVAKGAHRADSVAAAVTASPLVVTCVRDYDAVAATVGPVGPQLRGRTLANLTADTPDRARKLAGWADEHGIGYLDGAIMTPVASIGRPEAVFLYSGPADRYQAHRATLAALGGTATHVGAEPGRAAAYDVTLLDIFWTALSGVAHALALARAEGIPVLELVPFAEDILGVAAEVTKRLARNVDSGHHTGDDSALVSNAASMAHILHAAQARGIDSGVMAAAKAATDRAIQAGYGEDDFSRMVEVLSRSDRS